MDSKIVISREEGADAEEEHFIDDDVAEAQQQEANPKAPKCPNKLHRVLRLFRV